MAPEILEATSPQYPCVFITVTKCHQITLLTYLYDFLNLDTLTIDASYDERSDVWSLGCIILEMATCGFMDVSSNHVLLIISFWENVTTTCCLVHIRSKQKCQVFYFN